MILKYFLVVLSGILFSACSTKSTSNVADTTLVQVAIDSVLSANVVAMNNYDLQKSVDMFTDDATYALPNDGISQHGKAELDSVMKDVTIGHKKDSLKADVQWNTQSLLVRDSMAYQIVEQDYTIKPGSNEAFKGKSIFVITWKKQKNAKWKVHYLLSYPG